MLEVCSEGTNEKEEEGGIQEVRLAPTGWVTVGTGWYCGCWCRSSESGLEEVDLPFGGGSASPFIDEGDGSLQVRGREYRYF